MGSTVEREGAIGAVKDREIHLISGRGKVAWRDCMLAFSMDSKGL